MTREERLAEAAQGLMDGALVDALKNQRQDPNAKQRDPDFLKQAEAPARVRRPIDLQVLDAHILQAEGRVLELKALREDWGKLSPESQAAVFQYMQRSVR